ncbi:MAG: hypothetical protein NW237_02870 [Cyanobacteriota bacterium]|nr:hypothetical protein [Cyanobacteriota bacterium]
MEKETLDSFLSIQGVTGVALLGRKSRPYFYRSFQDLGKRQQDALIQGLFQVLDSMPPGFDFFDFQFAQQRVFVYPINAEWALLVSVDDSLILPVYNLAINKVRADLLQDTNRGLTTFRLLASQLETSGATSGSSPAGDPFPAADTALQVQDMVKAMNHLSQITTGYLGKAVIVNYWKAARQDVIAAQASYAPFLEQFQVERTAEIHYSGDQQQLGTVQERVLQAWVAAFVKRCQEVIRNFGYLLKSSSLTPEDWRALTGSRPN